MHSYRYANCYSFVEYLFWRAKNIIAALGSAVGPSCWHDRCKILTFSEEECQKSLGYGFVLLVHQEGNAKVHNFGERAKKLLPSGIVKNGSFYQ